MSYSFEFCLMFGEILLSDDKRGCAMVMFPHTKKLTLKSLLCDLRLIADCTGVRNLKKVMEREKAISNIHPKKRMYYLWFIGTLPGYQGAGIGSRLLKDMIRSAGNKNLPIFLETSTERNIPWYKKNGFFEYAQLDLGYRLHFFECPGTTL